MLKNIFHNAMVKAILDDQWLTIVIKHPHAGETNASGGKTMSSATSVGSEFLFAAVCRTANTERPKEEGFT